MVGKPPLETAGDAVCLIKARLRLKRRQTVSLLDWTELQHCLREDENAMISLTLSILLPALFSNITPFQCQRQLIFYSLWHLRQRWIFHRYTFQMWAARRRKIATWVNLFEHLSRLRLNCAITTLGSKTCQCRPRRQQDITDLKPGNLWKPLMALSVRKLWMIW